MAKDNKFLIGVDLGGTNIQAGIVTVDGKVSLPLASPAFNWHCRHCWHRTTAPRSSKQDRIRCR